MISLTQSIRPYRTLFRFVPIVRRIGKSNSMDCAEDFNGTSDCQSFDTALRKNHEIWSENQYPTEWSSNIVNETLDKVVTMEKVTAKPPKMNNITKNLKFLTIMSLNRGFLYNTEEIFIKVCK